MKNEKPNCIHHRDGATGQRAVKGLRTMNVPREKETFHKDIKLAQWQCSIGINRIVQLQKASGYNCENSTMYKFTITIGDFNTCLYKTRRELAKCRIDPIYPTNQFCQIYTCRHTTQKHQNVISLQVYMKYLLR